MSLPSTLTPITISYQPAYHGLAFWIPGQQGCYEELGLDVTHKVYLSGAPQVNDAYENKAWDLGEAGSVPNILGWSKGLETIGINNEEGDFNALVANAEGVKDWLSIVEAGTLGDNKIVVTPNSTGEFAVEKCLNFFNMTPDEDGRFQSYFVFGNQMDVIDELSTQNKSNYGSLWAPNIYTLLETLPDSEVICTGQTAGVSIPGGFMVRKEFGEEQPDVVAKALTCVLRGINFMLDIKYREEAESYMKEFYALHNVTIGEKGIKEEFTRPLFDLEGQLAMMKKAPQESGTSTLGSWFDETVSDMVRAGLLTESSELRSDEFINDSYFKLVAANETLVKFAMTHSGDEEEGGSSSGEGEISDTEDVSSSSVDECQSMSKYSVWWFSFIFIILSLH